MIIIPKRLEHWLADLLPLLDWTLWIGPAALTLSGVMAGAIVERLIMGAIHQTFHNGASRLRDSLCAVLKGLTLSLFTLWGLYMATYSMAFLGPDALSLIRKCLFAIGMLLAIQLLAKVSVVSLRFYLTNSRELAALPNTSIFENIVRIVVFVIGMIMLLQTLGVSVLPLLTALGVGGLAISLALQDTLANLFSGINMILARQIKVGDFIRLEGNFEGYVQDIGWRATTVRLLSNNMVIIPNSKIASSIITNFALPLPEMSTTVEASVSYESNLADVERVVKEVAHDVLKAVSGSVPDFEPLVRFHTFADSGILFSVILRVTSMEAQGLLRHEFVKALHARFAQEGIEIPFPQRVVQLAPHLHSALFPGDGESPLKRA